MRTNAAGVTGHWTLEGRVRGERSVVEVFQILLKETEMMGVKYQQGIMIKVKLNK